MPLKPPQSRSFVDAVLFDTFGTIVDWRSGVSAAVDELAAHCGFTVDPVEFALRWRGRYQPSMRAVRSGQRAFVDLDTLHRENLLATAEEMGVPLAQVDDDDLEWLNQAWHRLDGWPDSVPGLNRLKQRFIIGPLSNGHTALLTNMAKHAGLPWDVIIGSDITRAYKPDEVAYTRPAELLDLPPHRVMLCAAHNDDLVAARQAGLRTAFIPRPREYGPGQRADLRPGEACDVVARDVADLADQLLAAAAG